MTTEPVTDRPVLRSARAQRADLQKGLVALETAIAGPVPGRADAWAADVHEALVDVGAAFERHIAITEQPGGLLDDIVQAAPRLANACERVRSEHSHIRSAISDALVELRSLAGDRTPGRADEVRERILGLLTELSRHRQHGADLVYEAYAVDIGVGD